MKLSANTILFIILLVIYFAISVFERSPYQAGMIDWYTIGILSSLIVINASLLISGGIDLIAFRLLKNLKSKRSLFIFSVIVTLLLSMFLTNDVALIVLVPITVSIGRFSKEDVDSVIIFQAIAANVGSMLMPFGNPQNIIIYREDVGNFYQFLKYMSVPFMMSTLLLILMIFLTRQGPIVNRVEKMRDINGPLFTLNLLLLIIVIISFLYSMPYYIFIIAMIISIISIIVSDPSYLSKIDFILIFTFILIFYDINMIRQFLHFTMPSQGSTIFIESLILSQLISNVPTTVIFGKTVNWVPLAYGVDIGGNGTLIASLANLIAFRNMGKKDIIKFTSISMIFLSITGLMGYLLLEFLKL